MKQLILNSTTTFQQKVILIGVGLLMFIIGGLTVLWGIFYIFGLVEYSEIEIIDLINLVLFFFSFFLFSIAFSGSTLNVVGINLVPHGKIK